LKDTKKFSSDDSKDCLFPLQRDGLFSDISIDDFIIFSNDDEIKKLRELKQKLDCRR